MTQDAFDVDEQLARYALWRTGAGPRRVGALRADPGGPTVDFVENEVLVDPRDRVLVDELVERYGARVEEQPEIPPPPEAVGEGQMHVLGDAPPLPLTLTVGEDIAQRGVREGLSDALREVSPEAAASSPVAAAVAGIVARSADRSRGVRFNRVGQPVTTLPLEAPADINVEAGGPLDQCRILDAWQLLESVRTFGSIKPVVWVAVIDTGFWLDPATGAPVPPDLAGSQGFNLTSKTSRPWGPRGTVKNSQGVVTPWHGNGAASAAVAVVNGAGVAGAGGTVAKAFMFHSDALEESDVLFGVKCCYAWGLDVLSMSFANPGFGGSDWEEQFDFADRHGVVLVAAAGNNDARLPDKELYPATRTPGVITVGALDATGNGKDPLSNHGPSVNVWAPGTLMVAADPDNASAGHQSYSGTSAAAPVVAGVAAMMKAVSPGLTSSEARRLLHENGDRSLPQPAQPRMDALAAVWKAMNEAMPPDAPEGNEDRSTATPLTQLAPGRFGPARAGLSSIAGGDDDWWRFEVAGYADVRIELRWYRRLATVRPMVTGDGSPATEAAAEQLEQTRQGESTVITGLLAPGGYRIGLRADGPTVYRLIVTSTPRPLPRDQFEDNDRPDRAAHMLLVPPSDLIGGWRTRRWGPGTYDATLHRSGDLLDVDHYRFDTPGGGFFEPTVEVFGSDADLTLDLLSADGTPAGQSWQVAPGGGRKIRLPESTTCLLRVSGQRETRYRITTGVSWREGIPGEWEEVQILPEWWIDPPPDRFRDERAWLVDRRDEARGRVITFVTSPDVKVTATSAGGERVDFVPDAFGRVEIDVAELADDLNLLTARSVDTDRPAFIAQVPPMILG